MLADTPGGSREPCGHAQPSRRGSGERLRDARASRRGSRERAPLPVTPSAQNDSRARASTSAMTTALARAQGAPSSHDDPDPARAAFSRVEAVIRGVPPEAAPPPNLDGQRAAQRVLRAAPKFMSLRPRMASLSSELDLTRIDRCVDLAFAYCYARAAYVRTAPFVPLAARRREALALRRRLHAVMALLEDRPELRGGFVTSLRMTHSYESLSHDLTALARFFTDHAEHIARRAPVSATDVDRAGLLAALLLEAHDERAEQQRAYAAATRLAQQAFAALSDSYSEVRRAVQFLRFHEGDAERFAPSLYGGRRGGNGRTNAPSTTNSADRVNT